eukprot:365343-Chlamydomonas_euryale.AAC.8
MATPRQDNRPKRSALPGNPGTEGDASDIHGVLTRASEHTRVHSRLTYRAARRASQELSRGWTVRQRPSVRACQIGKSSSWHSIEKGSVARYSDPPALPRPRPRDTYAWQVPERPARSHAQDDGQARRKRRRMLVSSPRCGSMRVWRPALRLTCARAHAHAPLTPRTNAPTQNTPTLIRRHLVSCVYNRGTLRPSRASRQLALTS